MGTLLYIRLIGFTAGTLLMLFWMVVILGYRRQRNFERIFFFLSAALFLFYSGSLLALNAQLYYSRPPAALNHFAVLLISFGLAFLPPLLLHLHLEFAETRSIPVYSRTKRLTLSLAYLPSFYFLFFRMPAYWKSGFDFELPGNSLGRFYLLWLFILVLWSCVWEARFARNIANQPEKGFHRFLLAILALALGLIAVVHFVPLEGLGRREFLGTALALLPLPPLAALIYYVQRHNFLHIGRQKNLLYAVATTFVALLYLALVRRISESLAPFLPPEATAAILLFVLVIFIEPLQRALGRAMRETARRETDRVQRLMSEIQQEARQGNVEALARFLERRVQETFELRAVRVSFGETGEITVQRTALANEAGLVPLVRGKPTVAFSEGKISESFVHGASLGCVRAEPYGSALSGETRAALELLCEHLPAALDLCRAIDEKVRLERELSERDRLAALGQMAASISHNLKNPLGSIKTILQVQLESPEMQESLKAETRMVLAEISRLSNKLGQLLQFSRPAVLGESSAVCFLDEVVKEVIMVMRPEAEQKGISLDIAAEIGLRIVASREAVSDIVSNLLVNGLEAASRGGRVRVSVHPQDGLALLCVEDDGNGIPVELREKAMQPFFTTKIQGTGLGLAIVAKRVAEAAGKLELESPVADGRGTKFLVWLPLRGDAQ